MILRDRTMKKNNVIEKKIVQSLENSDKKPDKNILIAAKNEMRSKKEPKKKVAYRWAFAVCAVIALCLAVVLPLTLPNKSEFESIQYSSIYDYFKEKSIDINTYDHLFDKNLDPSGGVPAEESPYSAEECTLVKYKGEDVIIKQKYVCAAKDIINVSVLLADREDVKKAFFDDYSNLKNHTRFMKVEIGYYYDEQSKIGKATFVYKERSFYLEILCDGESVLLNHVQALIISQ